MKITCILENRFSIYIGIFLLLLSKGNIQSQPSDKGIGVLYLNDIYSKEVYCDSIIVLDKSMQQNLAVIYYNSSSGNYSVIGRNDTLYNTLLEFDNEKEGVSFQCIKGSVAKVSIKTGTKEIEGYIKIDKKRYSLIFWKKYLFKKNLFFTSDSLICIYNIKNGKKISFLLDENSLKEENLNDFSKYDYIMYPLKVDGDWMQVKIVTPSNNCGEDKKVRKKIVWIKYLDKNKKPLVWFYPRGC